MGPLFWLPTRGRGSQVSGGSTPASFPLTYQFNGDALSAGQFGFQPITSTTTFYEFWYASVDILNLFIASVGKTLTITASDTTTASFSINSVEDLGSNLMEVDVTFQAGTLALLVSTSFYSINAQ